MVLIVYCLRVTPEIPNEPKLVYFLQLFAMVVSISFCNDWFCATITELSTFTSCNQGDLEQQSGGYLEQGKVSIKGFGYFFKIKLTGFEDNDSGKLPVKYYLLRCCSF